jgi:hypothetical protein
MFPGQLPRVHVQFRPDSFQQGKALLFQLAGPEEQGLLHSEELVQFLDLPGHQDILLAPGQLQKVPVALDLVGKILYEPLTIHGSTALDQFIDQKPG